MRFTRLFPLALLVLNHAAIAQALPSAGGQLQQIPPAPQPPHPTPKISLVPAASAPGSATDDGEKISVERLRIDAVAGYSESDLLALTGFVAGSAYTLNDLQRMAARITDRLRSDGHILAQAYLPEQDIDSGVVRIAILEGRYGQVVVRNRSTLDTARVDGELQGIRRGEPITIQPLEGPLLRLSDLPGVNIGSTLAPGSRPGESDLIVDVDPAAALNGSIDADNAGSRYTGALRVGGTVNLNNPTGHGDLGSLRVLTSGSGLNYVRGAYQTRFGSWTGGVAYSWLGYELGREFDSLQAHGSARSASVYASYTLQRSRQTNHYLQLELADRTFQDRVDTTSTTVDKDALALTAGLRGDHLDDALGGRGLTNYTLTATLGKLDIKTAAAQTQDAATARTDGHYGKLDFSVARLQALTERLSLQAAFSGQIASKNLDVSEKIELGGVNAVRAYPEGEAYADEGCLLTLEARLQLPMWSDRLPSRLQAVGFFDAGRVSVNESPWAAGDNHRTLSGAGVALNAWSDNGFVTKLTYAYRLGGGAARSAPDARGRFWVQVVKYF